MRIVFFGTSAFAVPSLRALATAGHQIVRCATQPDRPQGRGLVMRPSPVKAVAQGSGLPIDEPTDLTATAEALRTEGVDLGVAIAYGRILPAALLAVPRHGMLGVHPSLLPQYRGANPIARALLDGLTTTGVTIFRLNERMDAGEIALRREVPIEPLETTEDLSKRLSVIGAELLVEVVAQIERGQVAWQPQAEDQATLAAKFTKDDGWIDWHAPAKRIDHLIRAVTPWPGATTTWRGQSLKILAARLVESIGEAAAGRVTKTSPEGLLVSTGEGRLLIIELQPAGGRRMTAAEFLRGHPLHAGEILGGDRTGANA